MSNLGASLQESFSTMVEGVSSYLPHLVAALAILILGWLVALVISKLVRAGLRRTTLDNKIAGWVRAEGEEVPDIA